MAGSGAGGPADGVEGSVCRSCPPWAEKKFWNLEPVLGLAGAPLSLTASSWVTLSTLGGGLAKLAKNLSGPISTAGADLILDFSASNALPRVVSRLERAAGGASALAEPPLLAFILSMNLLRSASV